MMDFLCIELLWALLFVGVLRASVHNDQKNIAAGQNVTLTCRAPNKNIVLVEWSRDDLGDEYVLMYRQGNFHPDKQHLSFKNRVDLQDGQMKDGDVSLIVKNVTTADNGTYECRVIQKAKNGLTLLCIITLSVVDPPGQTGGHTEDGGKEAGSVGLNAGLAVFVFLVVVGAFVGAFVGCWLFKKDKPQSEDSHRPPTELQIQMSESFLNSESPADEHRDRNDSKANNCHEHTTRIPDITLKNELVCPPQETAGLLPERNISVQ